MSAKRKFNSDAFEAIHSSASALFKVGAIDKATMRDFDETCLAVTPAIAPAVGAAILQALTSENRHAVAAAMDALETLCATCSHGAWSLDETGLTCRCPILDRDSFDEVYRIDRCGGHRPRPS